MQSVLWRFVLNARQIAVASFSQMELRAVEGIYISEGIKYLNVSEMSIEEISTRVLQNDRT